jgi:glycosyltransferase involved in cell wall biosynthesis
MRNVITHIGKSLEKEHTVVYAAYGDIAELPGLARRSDAVLICARATTKVFLLCKLLELFTPRLFFLLVQKPETGFMRLNTLSPVKCSYLAISAGDTAGLKLYKNRAYDIGVGIDQHKFRPLPPRVRSLLKEKYGFNETQPVVLHVGHCSAGRGLEDFALLDGACYQRVVVASGLFEDKETIQKLLGAGVRVISAYLPEIQELYQLADVYLFTTKTTEYVISVPLSVMEALSCGTPVVAFRALSSLSLIKTNTDKAIRLMERASEIQEAVTAAALLKSDASFLLEAQSWDETADQVLKVFQEHALCAR